MTVFGYAKTMRCTDGDRGKRLGTRGMLSRRVFVFGAGLWCGAGFWCRAIGKNAVISEAEMRQRCVILICRFSTTWPGNMLKANDELVIGVLGDDPFGRDKSFLKKFGSFARPLGEIGEFKREPRCHVVYIRSKVLRKFPNIMQALAGQNVMVFYDDPKFHAAGGMVCLHMRRATLHSDIYNAAVNLAGFKISKDILRKGVRGALRFNFK